MNKKQEYIHESQVASTSTGMIRTFSILCLEIYNNNMTYIIQINKYLLDISTNFQKSSTSQKRKEMHTSSDTRSSDLHDSSDYPTSAQPIRPRKMPKRKCTQSKLQHESSTSNYKRHK